MNKIVLFDSNPLMVAALKDFLSVNLPASQVLVYKGNPNELFSYLVAEHPALFIYEPNFPGSELHLLDNRLKRAKLETRTICYTADFSNWRTSHQFRSGTCGVVCKHEPLENLIQCIHEVLKGKVVYPDVPKALADYRHLKINHINCISKNELLTIKYLSEGLTTKEIAQKMNLSENTLHWYRKTLQAKFIVKNTHELVAVAFRTGIIK